MSWDAIYENNPRAAGPQRAVPPRRRPSQPFAVTGLVLLILVLCAVVAGLGVYSYFRGRGRVLDPNAEPRAVTPRGDLTDFEKTTIEVYKADSPSVVHITTLVDQQDGYSLNVQEVPQGTGSGFVWDKDGHIVTNYHVIQNADAARVTLWDHSTWKAMLVGGYPDKDMAVLHIDAPADVLHPIPVGTSHDLQVGQKVYAIGNPFGLDQTLTDGIVSALGREINSVTKRAIQNVIQTNAAINPGNSGGPLLDSAGRLIGMNTAIYSPSGSSAGIGFAIPVDEINRVVPQLIRSGKVTRPSLGVHVAPEQLAKQLDQKGALVMQVIPGSPAAKVGLRPTQKDRQGRIRVGDAIVGINDYKIDSANDLFNALDNYKAGDTVTLHLLRDGERTDVQVTLGERGRE
jgi:S1-C subfamily serine protease